MRVLRVLVVTVVLLALASPVAEAKSSDKLSDNLSALWTEVLELPAPQNPFTSNNFCFDLSQGRGGRVLVPFAPLNVSELTCTVRTGTKIFVSAFSSECSTAEADPYHGDNEVELRECARRVDKDVNPPIVTLDGRSVRVAEVETSLLNLVMPPDNILGATEGSSVQSVGHGWVALLSPMPPGKHTILLRTTGTYLDAPIDIKNTTTIMVKNGH